MGTNNGSHYPFLFCLGGFPLKEVCGISDNSYLKAGLSPSSTYLSPHAAVQGDPSKEGGLLKQENLNWAFPKPDLGRASSF